MVLREAALAEALRIVEGWMAEGVGLEPRRRNGVGFLVRGRGRDGFVEVVVGLGANARADAARRDVSVAGPLLGNADAFAGSWAETARRSSVGLLR